VGNSIKFRRPDTPARVHVGASREDGEWQLYVRDNGIGIGPEFADKVFVIFQRLHSKDAYPGTGIGLAICKKIVEYHGGRIWVDTEYRDGTLIRFTLPITDEPEDTGAEPTGSQESIAAVAATPDAVAAVDAGAVGAAAEPRAVPAGRAQSPTDKSRVEEPAS
jgi:hypothetical protein